MKGEWGVSCNTPKPHHKLSTLRGKQTTNKADSNQRYGSKPLIDTFPLGDCVIPDGGKKPLLSLCLITNQTDSLALFPQGLHVKWETSEERPGRCGTIACSPEQLSGKSKLNQTPPKKKKGRVEQTMTLSVMLYPKPIMAGKSDIPWAHGID